MGKVSDSIIASLRWSAGEKSFRLYHCKSEAICRWKNMSDVWQGSTEAVCCLFCKTDHKPNNGTDYYFVILNKLVLFIACRAIGKSLAQLDRIHIVTGGFYGVGETVGLSYHTERLNTGQTSYLWHILPVTDTRVGAFFLAQFESVIVNCKWC